MVINGIRRGSIILQYSNIDLIHIHPQQLQKGCCTLIKLTNYPCNARTLSTHLPLYPYMYSLHGRTNHFIFWLQPGNFRFTVQTNERRSPRTETDWTNVRPPAKRWCAFYGMQNNQSAQRTVQTQSILFMCKRKELLCVSFYTPHRVLAGNSASLVSSWGNSCGGRSCIVIRVLIIVYILQPTLVWVEHYITNKRGYGE